MCYFEGDTSSLKTRFVAALSTISAPADTIETPKGTLVELRMTVHSNRGNARAAHRVADLITTSCLERYAVHQLDKSTRQYELTLPVSSRDALDENVYVLLGEVYRIADDNGCSLEISVFDRGSGWRWN